MPHIRWARRVGLRDAGWNTLDHDEERRSSQARFRSISRLTTRETPVSDSFPWGSLTRPSRLHRRLITKSLRLASRLGPSSRSFQVMPRANPYEETLGAQQCVPADAFALRLLLGPHSVSVSNHPMFIEPDAGTGGSIELLVPRGHSTPE